MTKSENHKEEKNVNIKVLRPLFPGDRAIIRRTKEDGTVICQLSKGSGVETGTVIEDLSLTLDCILDRFEMLLNQLDDDESCDIITFGDVLIRDARMQLAEIFTFIYEDIGEISLTYDGDHGRQRCIGAFIGPPPEDRTSPYDLDPRQSEIV